MKLTDVPIYNEGGDLQFTATLTPEEVQYLLQFAINFKLAAASMMGLNMVSAGEPKQLDD